MRNSNESPYARGSRAHDLAQSLVPPVSPPCLFLTRDLMSCHKPSSPPRVQTLEYTHSKKIWCSARPSKVWSITYPSETQKKRPPDSEHHVPYARAFQFQRHDSLTQGNRPQRLPGCYWSVTQKTPWTILGGKRDKKTCRCARLQENASRVGMRYPSSWVQVWVQA